MRVRYEIVSWANGERDQMWKVWGRQRAQKVADETIRDNREAKIPTFEVGIFDSDAELVWYFSTDREREGLPPLLEGEVDLI
jgi:hypothetical protein